MKNHDENNKDKVIQYNSWEYKDGFDNIICY